MDLLDNGQIPVLTTSAEDPCGVVLMIHGIFSEKDEDGRFVRLSSLLAERGLSSVRFDLPGHGDSPKPSRDFTVAASLDDLESVAAYAHSLAGDLPLFVVASSFGGSVFLLNQTMGRRLQPDRVVLLNPVTDYTETFLRPFGSQMREIFSDAFFEQMELSGEATAKEEFVVGRELLDEFGKLRPVKGFSKLSAPTLVIHGTKDEAVRYETVKEHANLSAVTTFATIAGAAHAFAEEPYESQSFALVAEFLECP